MKDTEIIRIPTAVIFLMIAGLFFILPAVSSAAADIREPAVSGRFYPSDPDKLTAAVRAFMADARPASGNRPAAIVAPHAGYIFSGQICADAFNQAAGYDYDLIVILGTCHTAPGLDGASVYPGAGYRTPLGVIPVDEDAARRLLKSWNRMESLPRVHEREHSIEVMLPFIQILFPAAPILPVIVGNDRPDFCKTFGKKLAESLSGRKPLIVASTDLSHYPSYENALSADRATAERMAGWDIDRIHKEIRKNEAQGTPNLSTCACGLAPVLAAVSAAQYLGAHNARIISYANSGDSALGDRDRVVGYASLVYDRGTRGSLQSFFSDFSKSAPPPEHLTDARRQALLAFARKTIAQYLKSETAPLARGFDPPLYRHQGAFVTLKKKGRLRGCIGHMREDTPLCQVVGRMALHAAFNDRRFPPLSADELEEIEIEISVLTPFREVTGPEEIVPGRDGVVIRKKGKSAVYLPQVATEQGWNREEMLSHLCRKAGLSGDDWKSGAKFLSFQAAVFSESEQ